MVRRIDREKLIAFDDLDGPCDTPVNPLSSLALDAHAVNGIKKWLGAAVEDRQFELIQLNDCVVDAGAH